VGHGHPWITGTGVCSNSIESATKTSSKFALACQLGSLGLRCSLSPALYFSHFAIQPVANARCDRWLSPSSFHPSNLLTLHRMIKRRTRGRWRGANVLWSSCVMRPVNSCRTCIEACNIGFPRYNSRQYDSIGYTQYRLQYDTNLIIVRSLILRVCGALD